MCTTQCNYDLIIRDWRVHVKCLQLGEDVVLGNNDTSLKHELDMYCLFHSRHFLEAWTRHVLFVPLETLPWSSELDMYCLFHSRHFLEAWTRHVLFVPLETLPWSSELDMYCLFHSRHFLEAWTRHVLFVPLETLPGMLLLSEALCSIVSVCGTHLKFAVISLLLHTFRFSAHYEISFLAHLSFTNIIFSTF